MHNIQMFPAHECAVSKIEWNFSVNSDAIPVEGNLIFTSGLDGRVLVHDCREPWTKLQLSRTQGLTTISLVKPRSGIAFVETNCIGRIMKFSSLR
jgi:hypothetical protein